MKIMRFFIVYILIAAFCALLSAGCNGGETKNGAGPASGTGLRVRVVDDLSGTKSRVPNALVVLGDRNGALIATGTTDANGEYTFDTRPADATVTTAMECDPSGGGQSGVIYSLYDVNVPEVSIGGCTPLTPLGTMTLNITNSIGSAASNRIYIGRDGYYYNSLISSVTVTVHQHQLQNDGNLSIVVLALDASGPVGYGMVLDRPFVNGMTVAVDVDQVMGHLQYSMTNFPGFVTRVDSQINSTRKERTLTLFGNFISSPTSTIVDVAYFPGYGTEHSYYASAYIDRNGNGQYDAILSSGILGDTATPSNKSFNFSLMPSAPANITVSRATGTVTPTLSWSGTDGSTTRLFGYVSFTMAGFNMSFSAAPTRRSVVFPELPEALAQFRPNEWVSTFSLANTVSSAYSGYSDYLIKRDQLMSGSWAMPANTTTRQGVGLYNF